MSRSTLLLKTLIFLLLFGEGHILSASNGRFRQDTFFICPKGLEWQHRGANKCKSEDHYTCLYDYNVEGYNEFCNGPRKEQLGSKATINNGNFNSKSCSPVRFQPFIYSSVHNSECIFKKSVCTNEGSLTFSNGSFHEDATCRCDYTRGYKYVNKPKDPCHCKPGIEDCSCFKASCPLGDMLSPDYTCLKEETANNTESFLCDEIPKKIEDNITKATPLDVHNIKGYEDNTMKNVLLALILSVVFCIGISMVYIYSAKASSSFQTEVEDHKVTRTNEKGNSMTNSNTKCLNGYSNDLDAIEPKTSNSPSNEPSEL